MNTNVCPLEFFSEPNRSIEFSTLALVGLGQWREEQVPEALAARDRAALGLNAPPEGLYFAEAVYP